MGFKLSKYLSDNNISGQSSALPIDTFMARRREAEKTMLYSSVIADDNNQPQVKRPSYLSYLTPEVSEKVQEVARAKEIEKSAPLRSGAAGLYSKYAMESGSEIVQGTRAGLERGKLEEEKAHADEMAGVYGNLFGSPSTTPEEKNEALKQKNRFTAVSEEADKQLAALGNKGKTSVINPHEKLPAQPDFEYYAKVGAGISDAYKNSEIEGAVTAWEFFTEKEKDTYNYLLAKFGETAAKSYWDSMLDTTQQRLGGIYKERIEGIENPVARTAAKGAFALGAGVEQALGGLMQTTTEKELPTSGTQYGSQLIREELGTGGKLLYDFVNTTGNMLPSMLLSGGLSTAGAPAKLAKAIGSASMGVSAGGNTYKTALQEGMSEADAKVYARLVGASEGALGYALGGIDKLSGGLGTKLVQRAGAIEKGFLRFIAAHGASALSEATEEGLQAILEPVFKSMVTGEDPSVDWGEVAYNALLGGITGGILGGGAESETSGDGRRAGVVAPYEGTVPPLPRISKPEVAVAPAGSPAAQAQEAGEEVHVMGETENKVFDALAGKITDTKKVSEIYEYVARIVDGDTTLSNNDIIQRAHVSKNKHVREVINELTGSNLDVSKAEVSASTIKTQIREIINRINEQKQAEAAMVESLAAGEGIAAQTGTNIPANEMPTESEILAQNEADTAAAHRVKTTNKLTGEELAEETYAVMERLASGEGVSADEIGALKEVQEGRAALSKLTKDFVAAHPEFQNVKKEDVGTYLLYDEARTELRAKIVADRSAEGSVTFDSEGNEVYNGPVRKDRRIDIVIGLPASGKSSSIVNPMSQYYQSAVVDSDIIKTRLPEYGKGEGASLVHKESSDLNVAVLENVLETGTNIVLPIVGSKTKGVIEYIEQAKDYGYDVHIHLNELASSKAIGRMLQRYYDTGRFIDPAYALGYGDKPTAVYEEIKKRSDISGYSRWNNDVERGKRPEQRDVSDNNSTYAQYSGAWGRRGGEKTAGDTRTHGSDTDNARGISGDKPQNDQSSGAWGTRRGAETQENAGVQGNAESTGAGWGTDNRGRQDSGRVDRERPDSQSSGQRYESGGSDGRGNLGGYAGELSDASDKTSRQSIPEKTRKIMTDKGIPNVVLGETTDRGAFSVALENAKAANPNGGMVDPQSPENLQKNGSRTFMRADGMAGVAVERSGNIVGVFKNPELKTPNAVFDLVLTAVSNGGNHLDCYSTYAFNDLRVKYAKLGFKPVCYLEFNREYAPEGWNYEAWGEPDVVLWVHNGDTVEKIVERTEGYHVPTREEIHALPKFEDYDEAKSFQMEKVKEMQRDTRTRRFVETEILNGKGRVVPAQDEAPIEKSLTPEERRTARRDKIMQDAVRKMLGLDKKLSPMDSAIAMGKKLGVEVRSEKPSNGAEAQYENGVIRINPESKQPVMQMLVHELTHHIETSGMYQQFSDAIGKYISESLNVDLEYMKRAVKENYAEGGIELDDDGAMREVVAKFCEGKLFTDEEAINRLAQTNRNLFQKIYDWIKDTVAKVGASEETKFLIDAQHMYEKALRDATKGRGKSQNLYIGVNAKAWSYEGLDMAETLEDDGISAEQIHRMTGWHRGMDGKWRYEIDDGDMEYDRSGNLRGAVDKQWADEDAHNTWEDLLSSVNNEQFERLREYLHADIYGETEKEMQLRSELSKELGDPFVFWVEARDRQAETHENSAGGTLGDYINHPELFENYPELKNVKLVFEKMKDGTRGYYDPNRRLIAISEDLKGAPELTLIHEIQHAIQDIEGFATGASPEYWMAHINEAGTMGMQIIDEDIRHFAKKLQSIENETGFIKFEEALAEQMMRDEITEEQYDAEIDDFMEKHPALKKACEHMIQLRRIRAEIAKKNDPYELYRNTAGEIEARDSAARFYLDEYARRQIAPDMGDENTVFVEGEARWLASEKNNATQELSRGVTVSGSLADTTSAASGVNIAENTKSVKQNSYGASFDELVARAQAKKAADDEGTRRTMELFKPKQAEPKAVNAAPAAEPMSQRDRFMRDTVYRMMGFSTQQNDAQETSAEKSGEGVGVGAAEAGFSEHEAPGFAPTQSKGVTDSSWMDEQTKEQAAPADHQVISEQQSIVNAMQGIDLDENGNIANYEEAVDNLISLDKWTGADGDAAMVLMRAASRRGDWESLRNLAARYNALGTEAGQALQARKKWVAETPEDRLVGIIRAVNRLAAEHGARKGMEIKISDELLTEYKNAQTEAERDEVIAKMQKQVAGTIRPTLMDKWTALRYVNMLGNFKTQIRNFFGNASMKATYWAENEVATLIEVIANTASKGALGRTKSAGVGKKWMKAAKADYANVKNEVLRGGKYNDKNYEDDFTEGVEDKRRIFGKYNPMEYYRRGTNAAMEGGDAVFTKSAYARALAGYLKANGVSAEQFDAGNVDEALLDRAREYAVNRAQEQTFRDSNQFSDWVVKILRRNDTWKPARMVGEGLAPFRKTPANVMVRAMEFSPLGIVNTAVKVAQSKKAESEVTASDVVEALSKTLTGSGLFALGWVLSDWDLLRGGAGDDDEAIDELMNEQQWALDIPGVGSYTLDWAAPASLIMFTGANMQELMSDGELTLADMEEVITSLTEPMIQMSMLSGINDTLDSIKYSDNNLGQMVGQLTVGYLSQGLTNTLLGQFERTVEDTRMSTYTESESNLPTWLQRSIGKASAKTPGVDYNQTEYLDEFGNTESNGPVWQRVLENFFSPGYFEAGNEGKPAYDFAKWAHDNLGVDAFPDPYVNGSMSHEGEKLTLTQEEKERYQITRGIAAESYLEATAESEWFTKGTENGQRSVLERLMTMANGMAKSELLYERGLEEDVSETTLAIRELTPEQTVAYYSYDVAFDRLKDIKKVDEADIEAFEALLKDFRKLDKEVQNILLDDGTFAKFYSAYGERVPMHEIVTYYDIIRMEDNEGNKLDKAERKAEARKQGVRNFSALEDIFK